MHDDVPLLAVDDQISRTDLRCAIEIEILGRRLLVVPDVFARLRIQRDDRSREQVVAAPRRADFRRPRRAVACAEINITCDRIVSDGVPGCAAATKLPPLAGPGLGGPLQLRLLESLRRIAGHGPPAP